MVDGMVGLLGTVLLLLGLAVATIGLYGLLRTPDIFDRLHAAGLVTGPGVILVLLASLATGRAEIITSAFLVIVFVLVTASLSTHAIALAAWRLRDAGPRSPQGVSGAVDTWAGSSAGTATRVLLAHDGSADADVAVGLLAGLRWPAGTSIRLIAALEGDLTPLTPTEAPVRPAVVPVAELEGVRAAARLLAERGLGADVVVRRGHPAAAIVDEAAALDAQLVVVGSRGLGRLRSLLAGSIAAEVVDGAPCPVLIARSSRLERVLLASDGSDASLAATELLAAWSIFETVLVDVLSVGMPAARYPEDRTSRHLREAAEDARQQPIADAAVVRLREAGRRAVPHVRQGEAAAAIVAFAEEREVDLIVIGSRGRIGLTRTLLGSVAREVASSVATSVLIVRGPGEG